MSRKATLKESVYESLNSDRMITKVEKELILEYLESQALTSNVSEEMRKLNFYKQQLYEVNKKAFEDVFHKSPQSLEELKRSNEEYKSEQNLFAIANRKLLTKLERIEKVVDKGGTITTNYNVIQKIKSILEEE